MAVFLLLIFSYKRELNFEQTELPNVTVFVPFFNEEKSALINTLNSLDQQIFPNKLQILLINDGSTNETPNDVLNWLKLKRNHDFIMLNKEINDGRKGFALDYALDLQIASGEIYVVVDSDTSVNINGIHELVIKMESDQRYAAVCGFIAPDNHQDNYLAKMQHYEHIGYYGAIRSAQDKLGLVPVLAGAFVAHRASVVNEIGGWSEWLVEDIAWCWKAIASNYRTGYAPKAIAKTKCPTTHVSLFNQRRRWARGRVEAYLAAWKVSNSSGLISTPWFLITTLQYLFPPSILMLPILLYFNLYVPIYLGILSSIIYYILFSKFQKTYPNHNCKNSVNIISISVSTFILELIVWGPNILGYLDEVLRKKKHWLTR
ncbi:glycosyltransferase family 2 protein [Photobacterium leiognathi]|uniref:glycosyltransferase family 2 protein n=1 Tax=Photobacterium leiognathi TaxID=553611 RepID=UPI002980B7D3|nr:glycosyltransferase family 2 protein [Photobacterium leiognathi]